MKYYFIYCSNTPRNYANSMIFFARRLSFVYPTLFIELTKPPDLFISTKHKFVKTLRFFYSNKGLHIKEFRTNIFNALLTIKFLVLKMLRYRIILLTNVPVKNDIYSFIPYDYLFFDCTDQFTRNSFHANKQFIQTFDGIFVNSRTMHSVLSGFNNRIWTISPGYLTSPRRNVHGTKIPNSILYCGGISRRLDFDLLLRVAQECPSYELFFIGENYLTTHYPGNDHLTRWCLRQWKKLLQYPNVHYGGHVSHNEAMALMSSYRVGMLPYNKHYFMNVFSNPLKMYEYLLQGLPIVSTDLPIIREISRQYPILISRNKKEFIRNLQAAMRRTRDVRINRKQLFQTASVKGKVSQVVKCVRLVEHDDPRSR